MIAAVFDTNVLASGFTTQGGTPDRLLRLWLQGRFDLVVSTDIITELERTFQRPYFRRRIPATRRQRILALLHRRAQLTSLTVQVQGVATQPQDDQILAAAISAQADYLVTGDGKLQRVGTYRGVTIVSPRQFLGILAAQP